MPNFEHTISTEEKARIPTPAEAEVLAVFTGGAQSVFMGAPVVADDNRIVTSEDWDDGALTIAAQPDVPRNLTVDVTDADASVTGGVLSFIGEDPMGRPITEVMDIADALAWVGEKIFAKVTSATISATTGTPATGTDLVIVGVGNVIGIPWDMGVTSEVAHVYLGGTRLTPDAIAVGVSTSGIDTNGGTYDGSKLMQAFVKPARNVAGA